jgi:hypothetical protein
VGFHLEADGREGTVVTGATEAAQLASMTDHQVVAYWNILQFATRGLVIGDEGKNERHTAIMDGILTERSIAHEPGALTKVAA